ncbi:oxidoreductase [Neurospora intermedia]|uniref:Oxidoreductase n=1 Tax=Neurospora intermedia TaxID=5142 RepID=A0ABR3DN83_NEUIN
MLSYAVALIGILIVFNSPLNNLLFSNNVNPNQCPGQIPQLHRIPLSKLNLKEDLIALEGNSSLQCMPHTPAPVVHVYSREPLVLYIENFLSLDEREHLLGISEPLFEPSTTTSDGGQTTHRNTTVRDSEVAVIPRTDRVRCIENRAREIQGWRENVFIERLRTQRYRQGGHYNHHFDWSSNRGGWGRVSSFMVWVDDGDGSLVGGGTEFPRMKRPKDPRWCAFIECPGKTADKGDGLGQTPELGVTFKVIPGNAVYWENFRSDGTGRGWVEAWHAGLPVEKGVKVGLNIWSTGYIE